MSDEEEIEVPLWFLLLHQRERERERKREEESLPEDFVQLEIESELPEPIAPVVRESPVETPIHYDDDEVGA